MIIGRKINNNEVNLTESYSNSVLKCRRFYLKKISFFFFRKISIVAIIKQTRKIIAFTKLAKKIQKWKIKWEKNGVLKWWVAVIGFASK